MCIIFNKSLEKCYFPHFWKETLIIPILKGGNPSSAVNYRTISCSKILERYVYDWLIAHFGQLIVKEHHSWITDLLFQTFWFLATSFLNALFRQKVHAIYTDFPKSFVIIDHNILLFKLYLLNCSPSPPSIFSWLTSYLSYRSCKIWTSATVIVALLKQDSVNSPGPSFKKKTLCALFKICNCLMNCSTNTDFISHIVYGSADISEVPFAELDIYFHCPIPRLCRSYNALQFESFGAVSFLSFKHKLSHLLVPLSEDNIYLVYSL